MLVCYFFFFSSRRRHTRFDCDWSSTCALPISPCARSICSRRRRMSRRWRCWRGCEKTNAEVGTRNAEHQGEPGSPSDLSLLFRVPRFAFRLRGGGAVKYFVRDRKSTRLNSSHSQISYAVFCLKKKKMNKPV